MSKEQFIHVDSDGDRLYYSDRKMTIRHREDGPAIEYADGDKEWWVDDKNLSEQEFNERMNPVELTLEDIAEKFGVSVDQLKIKK